MARTFNTPPQRISKPTRGDVQNRFFNQYEWKGMHTDKNFLTVDQQTFQDCNNVYADSENLLKSRPAIKRTTDPLILDIGNIVNFWSFNDVSVYLSSDSGEFSIHFVKDGVVKYSGDIPSKDAKLKLVDNKIWILDNEYLAYFNTLDYSYNIADDFIYVPKTKVYSGLTEQENEPPNVLTNKEIYVYLYNNEVGLSSIIIGKTLTFKMLDETYTITFTKYTADTIVEKKCVVINAIHEDVRSRYYVDVSKDGAILYYNKSTYSILYSPDGVTFTRTLNLSSAIDLSNAIESNINDVLTDKPKFSMDGTLIYITIRYVYADSPSWGTLRLTAISVIGSEFVNWTDLRYGDYEGTVNNVGGYVFDSSLYTLYEWHPRFETAEVHAYVKYSNSDTNSLTFSLPENFTDSNGFACKFDNIHNLKCIVAKSSTIVALCVLVITAVKQDTGELKYYDVYISFTTPEPGLNYLSFNSIRYINVPKVGQGVKVCELRDGGNIFHVLTTYVNSYVLSTVSKVDGTLLTYGYNNMDNTIVTDANLITDAYYNYDCSKLLTNEGVFDLRTKHLEHLITGNNCIPVGFNQYIYYINDKDDIILSNNVDTTIELHETVGSGYNYFSPSHESELSAQYWSKDNNLYISQYAEDDDGNFMWYFPKSHVQKFNYPITNLIPISKNEMGVFFEHEIWYVESDLLNENLVYRYTKSKLPVGMREGSDVIVTFDGSAILFTCERGLVMLAYQDLVASTEQTLTFASDNIATLFKEFNDGPIKLYEYDFWIVVYKQNSNKLLVYDKRTGSWYPQTIVDNLQKIVTVDYKPQLLKGGTIYNLDNDVDAYFDYDGNKKYNIQWNITSQKLHLGANNHYKHVYNITLSSVLDTETPLSMILNVQNYRKQIDAGKPQILEYKVDTIRTFVKRLNHAKINEFQYLLSNDEDNVIQKPLSLANISVKYKILEEVR